MDEQDEKDSSGITRALGAYHHYSKHNSSLIKDELLREGKDASFGAVASTVAVKWRELGDAEKAKYLEMARIDRERYEKECAIRDEEVLRQQEEKRLANALVPTETRMRNSTLASTDASQIREDAPKRTREISEKELEAKEARRQEKAEENRILKGQSLELKKQKAEQAEARLKYLLSQSDIFSHFGAVSAGGGVPTVAAPVANSKNSRRKASAEDELDEDEKRIAQELGDEEDTAEKKTPHTFLKVQPSCVSGGEMRAYQLEGLNWMIRLQENGINGILADEMGLGKTLQSISILGFMKEYRNVLGPHLVMVPKSTLSNWCNEFKRWCPSIRILRFHGSKEERLEIVLENFRTVKSHDERNWDVVVTTYEVVNLERSALTKISWKYLIIDEAHRLKNEASQFSQTVRLLQTQYRLLLTGTPLQNNLHELWALLNFLLPDVFASSEQFDEWFNLDVDDAEAKQRMIGQLHKLLRPFMLRRLKADVEKSLPPKSETILFTGMSVEQKELYRKILLREIDVVNGGGGNNAGSRTAVLNIVMQLRKCCNHPYLFPGVEDVSKDPLGEHLFQSCGKMVLLHKLLLKMKERGHRVLVFSQMTRMIDILEDYFISQGYEYCRIDGNTSYEDREDRIHEFNKPDSSKFIFVLSTRAGGLGINLQTADTVILYDSDWNPQADLQAQDRAHRIGQKKPVQVFRLVTDDTVEVKVVERAQQKLKLDAMVVQQGRLQDKEKKMSKQELLDTIRFGADKIFRSKESSITDEDIDRILEEGRKRTEEMSETLQVAEKGDLYDFRLDGGMSSQIFEGKDYSSREARQAELNALSGLAFIDTGKRERKAIASYSETIARQQAEESDRKPKLPKHMRLVRMEDWQFYNRERLTELHTEESKLFEKMAENGELPTSSAALAKINVLPADLLEEKTHLLSEAFSDWTKNHYNNFVRASARHGRNEYAKIAQDVGRSVDDVTRYAKKFWEGGPTMLPAQEWERVTKLIEKGEKRIEEISRLTEATAKLIMMFDDPWEELTFRNVGNTGRIFNAIEDRFLLCLTHLHGYGNWDQVRNSIKRCERFRFDFYLQSCSAETLGKRCESLMRSAERELIEIERKKQVVEAQAVTSTKPKLGESMRERVGELTKQIADEAKRLANIRIQLQKIKAGEPVPASVAKAVSTATKEPTAAKKLAKLKEAEALPPGRAVVNIVAEGWYPELCKLLVAAGPEGIYKVVEQFLAKHPLVSKRQVELKISELAVKEKREEDKYKVWHIRPEFEKYLSMDNFESVTVAKSQPCGPKPKALKAAVAATPKRKREDDEGNIGSAEKNGSSSSREPKKYKRAFGFFVKAKKAEAEKQLGSDYQLDRLRDLLTEMWNNVDDKTKKIFELKEQEDKARYDKEMETFRRENGSTTKKAKVSQ